MDYDFFNDNNQQKGQGNDTQRIPAPMQNEYMPTPKKKNGVGKVIVSIAVAVSIFLSGMWATWMLIDPEIRTLLAVKRKIQSDYYQEITDEEFYRAIFGGINDDLLDAYSEYMTPEEFAAMYSDMQGNRSGIGLVFGAQTDDPLRITRVCGNSPAEEVGIVAGERVVACGRTEAELTPCQTFAEFSQILGGFADEEQFVLKLELGNEERCVTVCKTAYVENNVFYRSSTSAYAFTGANAQVLTEKGAPLTCLDEDTAYIRLIQFTGNAANEFALAMGQFRKEGKKNLILDLRENGGGYLDIMQSIASYFCKTTTERQPIVAVADFGEKTTQYRATANYYDGYFVEDSRICVLADKYSASASECLLGSMLDYGAIGYQDICLIERGGVAKTYGKGIMQETSYVSMVNQDAITLTTAEIRWPVSNNSIHGRGILPEDGTVVCIENADYETETINAVKALLG